ncbi:hypothetical protein BKP35_16330 [Anaerobacillus arseniciselenatis]|uniref:Uncharacterized protein n=1 Tax=Anaerobacillus arseniciselenatis TaxID=85682 RepID=A0A1S2LAJ5_9BACI|nr:hypothetical protein [Anaerobacillus arseniciselenatis]OIJ09421.1 hypothetical protein BKP35_16330 [Anaerobacillus arseniciselenatis]
MDKKLYLDVNLFHDYYDSGCGNPFDEVEIRDFCLKYTHLFTHAAQQVNTDCDVCKSDTGMSYAYIFNFYDDEEDYKLVASMVSGLPSFEDFEEELAQLAIIPCTECGRWQVTH